MQCKLHCAIPHRGLSNKGGGGMKKGHHINHYSNVLHWMKAVTTILLSKWLWLRSCGHLKCVSRTYYSSISENTQLGMDFCRILSKLFGIACLTNIFTIVMICNSAELLTMWSIVSFLTANKASHSVFWDALSLCFLLYLHFQSIFLLPLSRTV